ncbi:PKD domain-containing protein [Actinoplanes sp. CA-030573]|uniref:PKD domain-containing protein n=1 Tax=Actinoplanes sp. CA-030573 TaxID=3239898 RepID=UPI003D939DE6
MKLPLLALALTAGLVAVGTPARADDAPAVAPTATYTLDSAAIWAGQRVTLTESGRNGPATTTRTIDWGDGTVETPGTPTHSYASPGSYGIKVTLTDGTETGTGVFPAGSTVTVTTSPGTYSWERPTIYTYPGYMEQGSMLASGLPTASQVWTGWGDGETSLLASAAGTSVAHWYGTGRWTPSITVQNAQGRATPRPAASLTVLNDVTTPSVSLTVPSTPSKASSWSTVKGKASDTQSGVDVVGVQAYKWNASTTYYYNFVSKSWVTYTGQDLPDAAQALLTVDGSGTWSTPVAGLGKGYTLQVWYYAWDKVGNGTDSYNATYALTS